jgi:O-antigen/teichoic acid export membrane protein
VGALGRRANGSLSKSGVIVAVSMAFGNALNYLYLVVMSRQLGPASFGALGALTALSFIISVPGMALQSVVARHTAIRTAAGEDVHTLWSGAARLVLIGGGTLAICAAALSPLVVRFLHLDSVGPALWLAASLVVLPMVPALVGMLQGVERFAELSAVLLAVALAKIALGIALVALGFGVSGALAGAALGALAACALGLSWTRPSLRRGWLAGPMIREIVRATAAILGLFLAVNLDVVLARHFLPATVSGLYAVGTVAARAAYWAPRFVIVVLFPRLATSGDRRTMLRRGALVVLAFAVVAMLLVVLASRFLLGNVFGDDYASLGSALWLFAAIGTAFALVQLLLFAGIAAGDDRMAKALWIAVALKTTLIVVYFHHSLVQVASVVLAAALSLLAVGVLVERRRDASAGANGAAGPAGAAGAPTGLDLEVASGI